MTNTTIIPKTWTATDLKLGKLTINRSGSTLQVERRYRFLDEFDEVLAQVAGGRLLLNVAIADVPADILSALQTIDNWTKQQALEQEGMH